MTTDTTTRSTSDDESPSTTRPVSRPASGLTLGSPVGGSRVSLQSAFAALEHRDYRVLWFSMIASFSGMQMQFVARGWLAFELTGSFTQVGIVSMAWGVPQLFLSLVGGAVADRMDKRNLVLISQAGTGVLAALTALLITSGWISIPWLFALGVAQGTVFAFNMPARQALLPEIVPQSQLMNAVALNNAAMNGTSIVAPAIAGVMLGLWGVESAYYAQTGMLLIVMALMFQLPHGTSHLAGAEARGNVLHEIGVGLRYIVGARTLRLMMMLALVPMLVGLPYNSLLPGFAVRELGLAAGGFGLMFTATGIGALVGSLVVAALTEFTRKPLLQLITGFGFGGGLVMLAVDAGLFGYPGALVALVLLGFSATAYQTLCTTMMLGVTRPEFFGRVMSVYMLGFSVVPLMSAPIGIVADHITAKATFALEGVIISAFILLVALTVRGYGWSSGSGAMSATGADAPAAP
jgi:MFS family permease